MQRETTVSCGIRHSAVILDDDVFTWGKSSLGRLGTGNLNLDVPFCPIARVEHLDLLKVQVMSVSCGYGMLVMLIFFP
jgi:alpha-tubulin suppressor-like RCC1 family protein